MMHSDIQDLPEDERAILCALLRAVEAEPYAEWFEHQSPAVRQIGSATNATIPARRQVLRQLNHRGLLMFDRSKAPRWVFRVAANAVEFTV